MLKPSEFPSLYNEAHQELPVSYDEVYPISLDFIGLGSPRSGTTWMARHLRNHPQVVMSGEAPFFTPRAHATGLWNKEKLLQRYQEIAATKPHQKILWGNYHSSYLYSGYTLHYFKKHFPDRKFYLVLRNPIERAISHYLFMTLLDWTIPLETSFAYCLLDDTYVYHLLEKGYYDVYLQKWLRHFDREQFLIIIHEDIKNNPQKIFSQIKDFLGLEVNFNKESMNKKVNPSRVKGTYLSDDLLSFLEEAFTPTRLYFEQLLNRDLSVIWSKDTPKARHQGKLTQEQAFLAKGMLAYEHGHLDLAVKLLMELFKKKTPNPLVYEILAEIFRNLGKHQEAETITDAGRLLIDVDRADQLWN